MTIVGSDGVPVPDGESGEILLSNLVNRGSVLLNYRIGDLGRIATGPCACGRTSKVLAELEGRVSEYITLADGSLMGPFGVTMAVSGFAGVVRYQLVQLTDASFELRLATVDRAAFDRVAPVAEDAVRAILGGYDVEATYVEEIVVEPGRKYRPIVLLDSPA